MGNVFRGKWKAKSSPGSSQATVIGNATSFQMAFESMRRDWDNRIRDSRTPDREAKKKCQGCYTYGWLNCVATLCFQSTALAGSSS